MNPIRSGMVAAAGLGRWARLSYGLVRDEGVAGAVESTRMFRSGLWRLAGLVSNYGVPIYEMEWDILVVLDACRADLMAEVADQYEFVEFDAIDSVASASPEWMEKNFTGEYADELGDTAYVTGNPYTRNALDPDRFLLVDEVWEYAWDDDLGTVRAEAMTDRAIQVHRRRSPGRMIVHYMQPHHPFVPTPLDPGMDREAGRGSFGRGDSVWSDLRRGRFSREEVWRAYRENLEYALDNVAVLLDNVDAEVVAITSDHGNALGEHGLYGHPIYVPIEPLKRVPWCVTSARDTGTHRPTGSTSGDGDGPGESLRRKLRDLGYV